MYFREATHGQEIRSLTGCEKVEEEAMARVTLIFEYNAYQSEPRATLWTVINDDYDVNAPGAPYPGEDPRARRILGPIDFHLCGELEENLCGLFTELGYEVVRQPIADD